VTTGGADTAHPTGGGPAGDCLGVDPEQIGDFAGGEELVRSTQVGFLSLRVGRVVQATERALHALVSYSRSLILNRSKSLFCQVTEAEWTAISHLPDRTKGQI
jgi:hypothetical protein